jgi:hypothetical protein
MDRYPEILGRDQLKKMVEDKKKNKTTVTLEDIKNNIFITVPGLKYVKVNKLGEVYDVKNKVIKNQHLKLKNDGKNKYVHIRAVNNYKKAVSMLLHILMAKTFIRIPSKLKGCKLEVNHIDGNRRNFSISNLEWGLKSDNMIHSVKILGNTKSLLSPPKEVRVEDLKTMKIFTLYSLGEASRYIGVGLSTLHGYLNREENKNILKSRYKVFYNK